MTSRAEQERWTIYACVEDDCDYYRDTLNTGVHRVWDGSGSGKLHQLEPVVVASIERAEQHHVGRMAPLIEATADCEARALSAEAELERVRQKLREGAV